VVAVDRRVRGFGLTVLAIGVVLVLAGALFAARIVALPVDGGGFWGTLLVVGAIHLILALLYLVVAPRRRLASGTLIGLVLWKTPRFALPLAALESILLILHIAAPPWPGAPPALVAFVTDLDVFLSLTAAILLIAILGIVAALWGWEDGTRTRKGAVLHGLAAASFLALCPWIAFSVAALLP